MMPELALTIFSFAALVIIVLALWIRHRNQQMAHQERLAALEKGTALPLRPAKDPWSPRVYLLRGLIWTFGGATLTIALLGASLSDHRHYRDSAEVRAWHARNVSQNLQIPLEQARQIVEKDEAERAAQDTGMPPAICLFGLIPLGVGLAYLVFYRAAGQDGAANSLA